MNLIKRILDRRQFNIASVGIVAGFGTAGVLNPLAGSCETQTKIDNPIDVSYLQKGINALARAHQMSSMAGHLGASLIAGYFVHAQRPDLHPAVFTGIKGDLDRVIRGESVFGKKMSKRSKLSDNEMFAPFAKQKADETLIDGIAEGLEKSISKPRQSGHNVIFASLAIRALKTHPEFSTPAVADGIGKLMKLFSTATPGSGFYGKKRGRIHGNKIELPADDGTPMYDDIRGMANAVLDETVKLTPTVVRTGYGGLVHIINHCAAITDLAELGYSELAKRAVPSHRQHLRLWRNLPNLADEQGPLKVSKFTPHMAEYWKRDDIPYDRALLTHRVKTMYGFDEMAAAVEEEKKEKAAYDKLRLMM